MSANDSELLDHFAGLAMQAIITNESLRCGFLRDAKREKILAEDMIAADSYRMARAMLYRRSQPADLTDLPFGRGMVLCPVCGNKRCPKANDPRNECTNSNEPGQKGSTYE